MKPPITDHDCCGRCRRGWDCLSAAQRDYDGPGNFAHTYFAEMFLNPRGAVREVSQAVDSADAALCQV
ncbi:hypothetical protein Aros01_08771 [Streptosporangium roseum]|uniref:Uncharacterized protein n=1 Tax=Streptosporangium roseum (strain ATCC 12428 / DSM 43021 / JCM 3005 / KCTC 9067 / NCIMB 10171 / NRRL 2505 / NI 9100) TaxID=479432 RepID=D2AZA1_STRRD|nr:hypothetical protein Sros_0250 [Streptosporangium roseum DSM 43021]